MAVPFVCYRAHIFMFFFELIYPPSNHEFTQEIGSVHLTNLSVNFSRFGVPRIEKSHDQPYLAYNGMLECFKHFKRSPSKCRVSQKSENAFHRLPMTEQKAYACLN
ncbi:hypothetical protein TNCV_431741 [Trichonephila clavipes]|nr:hypothetical protein TNCV_431741 [Trichonephila clavipes]